MNITINGLSQFFFFAIPAILGLAALYWLAFGQGLHYFRRALSQEKRHAEAVGAAVLPKEPLKITIGDSRNSQIRVDTVELDGGDLWLYYKNVSQSTINHIQFTWKQIAPDGTVVKSDHGYISASSSNNAPGSLDGGQRGEAHLKISADPRAVVFAIRMHTLYD